MYKLTVLFIYEGFGTVLQRINIDFKTCSKAFSYTQKESYVVKK